MDVIVSFVKKIVIIYNVAIEAKQDPKLPLKL